MIKDAIEFARQFWLDEVLPKRAKLVRDLNVGDHVFFPEENLCRRVQERTVSDTCLLSNPGIGLRTAAAIEIVFDDGMRVWGHPRQLVETPPRSTGLR